MGGMSVIGKGTVGIEITAHSFVSKFWHEMFLPDLFVLIWFVEVKLLLENV